MAVTTSDTRTIAELGGLTIWQLSNVPEVRPDVTAGLRPVARATITPRTVPKGEVKWRSS